MFLTLKPALSSTTYSNRKAVLTIEEIAEGLKGSLRLYNFNSELAGISSLGFYNCVHRNISYRHNFHNLDTLPCRFLFQFLLFQLLENLHGI